MQRYSLFHLSDEALLRDLAALVARDRATTAALLAHIAEVDARKLYLPAAYPSMFAYCVGELRLSEDAAFSRIRAARTARQFPAIFEALAEGRLQLSSVLLLTPYLTPETASELLAAATHKTKSEIERLLAERFPRPDVLDWVEELVPGRAGEDLQLVPERVGEGPQLAPAQVQPQLGSGQVGERPRVKPLGPQSFAVQFTLTRSAHDRLRYAQELLGHQIPSADVAAVYERAIEALIPQLEQRKFAATARPRSGPQRPTSTPRHIPAHVKRAVWERDGGRCTFESETGRRCEARTRLEFDHIEEVARGGDATVAGVRVRCRPHNQYEAERTFGSEFMRHKRIAANESRATAKADAAAARIHATGREQAAAAEQAPELDVVPWLRRLGFGVSEARHAAALCQDMANASLEERVRAALSYIPVRGTRVVRGASRDGDVTRPFGSLGAGP